MAGSAKKRLADPLIDARTIFADEQFANALFRDMMSRAEQTAKQTLSRRHDADALANPLGDREIARSLIELVKSSRRQLRRRETVARLAVAATFIGSMTQRLGLSYERELSDKFVAIGMAKRKADAKTRADLANDHRKACALYAELLAKNPTATKGRLVGMVAEQFGKNRRTIFRWLADGQPQKVTRSNRVTK